MPSITNTGGGNTNANPDAEPELHRNMSLVFIDHELDYQIAASAEDEAEENGGHPNLTVIYTDHHLDGSVPSDAIRGSRGPNALAAQTSVIPGQNGLYSLPPGLRLMIWGLLFPEKRHLGAKAWLGIQQDTPLVRTDHNDKGCGRNSMRKLRYLLVHLSIT